MPAGRPSKYDPAMCARVVELMREGCSKYEVCADLGIATSTFALWREQYAELSEAVKTGEDLSRSWWEREGRQSLRDKEFNSTLWYMNMKNRHGWTDKRQLEHSGPSGGPMVIKWMGADEDGEDE